MKPLLIIHDSKPLPHYRVHFEKHVEFRTLKGKLLGTSKVEAAT